MKNMVLMIGFLVSGCSLFGGNGITVDQAQLGVVAGASISCVSNIVAVASDPSVTAACRAAIKPAENSCRDAYSKIQDLGKDAN